MHAGLYDPGRRPDGHWTRRRVGLRVSACSFLCTAWTSYSTDAFPSVVRLVVHISGKFEDEISKELKHTGAGVVSMVLSSAEDAGDVAIDPLEKLMTASYGERMGEYAGERRAKHEREPVLRHAGANTVAGRCVVASAFFLSRSTVSLTASWMLFAGTWWLWWWNVVGKHTVFGRISDGMKVIQRMGLVPTGADDRCDDNGSKRFLENGLRATATRVLTALFLCRPDRVTRSVSSKRTRVRSSDSADSSVNGIARHVGDFRDHCPFACRSLAHFLAITDGYSDRNGRASWVSHARLLRRHGALVRARSGLVCGSVDETKVD